MRIVIEGAGEIGSHLAKMLSREDNEITVIDTDSQRLARLTGGADVAVVQGHPSSIQTMKAAGVPTADLFIAVNPFVPQDVNIVSAILAYKLGARKVSARVDDEEFLEPENKVMFKELGLDLMFFPERIAAEEIADQLKYTASSESMNFANGKLGIAVFKIDNDSPLLDMTVKEFAETAGENELFRIIAITRNDETIIPKYNTRFKYCDMVFTISRREGSEMLMRRLGKNNITVRRLMIVGGSVMAEQVAKSLANSNVSIKIIENDRARCLELRERLDDSVAIVCGDGRNTDLLVEELITEYDAFAALTGSDETNVLACAAAKRFGVDLTIADVEHKEYIHLAEEIGVDTVINKKLLTAGKIFKFTLSGKARSIRYMSGTNAEILEYIVAPGSAITKGRLMDIGFPAGAVIGGVIRGSEAFIAVGSTRIEKYDRVVVFAMPETAREVDRFFKKDNGELSSDREHI
ncbi:MAG: Trk system potassium transporter TrkA [Bacteroidales bacterium]|nr:Trk system potassium transporter TrkA [Bacteroidales bacterium]